MHARSRILVAAALVLTLAAGCSSGSSDGSKTTTTKAETTTTTGTDDTMSGDTTTTSAGDTTTTKAGSSDGPTDDEVSAGLQKGLGFPKDKADCVAKELRKTVSATNLQAFADQNPDLVPKDETAKVQSDLQTAMATCS